MSVITLINSLLDSKLVRWALLALLSLLVIAMVFFGFKYNALKLSNLLLEKEKTDLSAAMLVQNQAIQRMAEQTKSQEEALKQATIKASKIAIETKALLKSISEYKFSGTCDDKVSQAVDQIQKVK